MSETVKEELPSFDLERTEIDWSKITAKETEKGRWSFNVSSREEGRKIGFEFAKGIGEPFTSQAKRYLEDPKPIDDIRLDGGQISFSEYDEDFSPKGDITLVEIYMRYYADDPEFYAKYAFAMNPVLTKIGLPTI